MATQISYDPNSEYFKSLSPRVKRRITIERQVILKAVQVLIADEYEIAVHNGEETVLEYSQDEKKIMAAIMTTDEDQLKARKKQIPSSRQNSWIRLIYGNDGPDVISDYGLNFEELLKPVFEYAETLY